MSQPPASPGQHTPRPPRWKAWWDWLALLLLRARAWLRAIVSQRPARRALPVGVRSQVEVTPQGVRPGRVFAQLPVSLRPVVGNPRQAAAGAWRGFGPPPRKATRFRALILALCLLCIWLLLTLLLTGGAGRRGATRAAFHVATGTVLQATEQSGSPSAQDPTGKGSPAAQPNSATALPIQDTRPLTLSITCAEGANNRYGQVCVHTSPHAELTINVTYCDGTQARNVNLQGPTYADDNGDFTWSWVPEHVCSGLATIHVTAANDRGQSMDSTQIINIP